MMNERQYGSTPDSLEPAIHKQMAEKNYTLFIYTDFVVCIKIQT